MKAWLERLSLRYKLTLAALAVEVVMFAFLIGNGVQLTNHALQQQADQRVHEVAKTLAVALSTPLSQQDDISVRDIIESLQRDGDLITIEVRDSNSRIVHQTSNGARISESDFRVSQAIELAGQHYGEVALVLSSRFILETRARYLQQSLLIAAAALLLTGLLLALSAGSIIRRFEVLTRAVSPLHLRPQRVPLDVAGLRVGHVHPPIRPEQPRIRRAHRRRRLPRQGVGPRRRVDRAHQFLVERIHNRHVEARVDRHREEGLIDERPVWKAEGDIA